MDGAFTSIAFNVHVIYEDSQARPPMTVKTIRPVARSTNPPALILFLLTLGVPGKSSFLGTASAIFLFFLFYRPRVLDIPHPYLLLHSSFFSLLFLLVAQTVRTHILAKLHGDCPLRMSTQSSRDA